MTTKDKKYLKYFFIFLITLLIFSLGISTGKAYVIKYQQIHKTNNGFCVELDNKEWEYNNE